MSTSQWLDIAVLAVAFIGAVSGWRSGALGSLLSFVNISTDWQLSAQGGILILVLAMRAFTRRTVQ